MKINVRIFGIAFFLFISPLYAQSLNSSQVLPPGHWIYDSLKTLGMEQKTVFFNENSMMTVSEIRFYFEQLDEDSLSESGKKLYEEAENFLYENDSLIDLTPFRFDIGLKLNGEGYYKTSNDIPWSFRYNYKDNLATFPIKAGFSDYITLETDPFVGKAHYGSYRNENYTNFPYRDGDFEFRFPRFSYGSLAGAFNGWGANIHIGTEGFQIGDTRIGSVIYNHIPAQILCHYLRQRDYLLRPCHSRTQRRRGEGIRYGRWPDRRRIPGRRRDPRTAYRAG